MIDIIGSAITDEIVRRLKDAEIFAVMADETPDTSVSRRNRREITCSSSSR